MSNEEKTKNEASTTLSLQEEENNFKQALSKALEPLTERIEEMQEKLEILEKAAPGSQSEEGEEEPKEQSKGFKGVSFLGSGPE